MKNLDDDHTDYVLKTGRAGTLSAPARFNPKEDSAADMLAYFKHRNHVRYFALKPGQAKHVIKADRVLCNEFVFNNEKHVLKENFDWQVNPSADREWLILLHKFYYSRDLALAYDYTRDERYAQKWVELVQSWISSVPVGFIDSQVTGRRLQQWLLAYHYFVPGRECSAITPDFLQNLLVSMQAQAEFLCRNLTKEGNHRTIELAGLFGFAVSFPELPQAEEMKLFAQQELLENFKQDFLADGVQKELSTDYHHIVLKNFLSVRELAVLNCVDMSAEFDRLLEKALDFSLYAHKPDGFLPAINDGDINSYLSVLNKANRYFAKDEILYVVSKGQAGQEPKPRSKWFRESGYCILRSDWAEKPYADGRYLFFDAGSLGYGSHGHYDLLSFEAAAYGRSLIIDPGRYTYLDEEIEGVNWRHAFKGTAAHNTVMIDGKDQIAYRGDRPVGPEPKAEVIDFVSLSGFDYVRGSASSPEYPVEHQRSICFIEDQYWVICDRLTGKGCHDYQQFFHLATDTLDAVKSFNEPHGCGCISPNLLVIQPAVSDINLSIQTGYFSPEYGHKQIALVLCFAQKTVDTAWFQTVLFPFKSNAPKLKVSQLTVVNDYTGSPCSEAKALHIGINQDGFAFNDYVLFNAGATDNPVCFDEITCKARSLVIRMNSDNQLLSIYASELAYLKIGQRELLNQLDQGIDMSFNQGSLELHFQSASFKQSNVNISELNQIVFDFIQRCGEFTVC